MNKSQWRHFTRVDFDALDQLSQQATHRAHAASAGQHNNGYHATSDAFGKFATALEAAHAELASTLHDQGVFHP